MRLYLIVVIHSSAQDDIILFGNLALLRSLQALACHLAVFRQRGWGRLTPHLYFVVSNFSVAVL